MRPALCLLLALAGSGCLDVIGPDVGPSQAARCVNDALSPAVTVTFAHDIQPIIQARCVRCHSEGGLGYEVADLNLSSYQALRAGGTIGGSGIVVPGLPCQSIIVQKLSEAPPFGARMPLTGPPYLSDAERALVHDWIAEGAHER